MRPPQPLHVWWPHWNTRALRAAKHTGHSSSSGSSQASSYSMCEWGGRGTSKNRLDVGGGGRSAGTNRGSEWGQVGGFRVCPSRWAVCGVVLS